MNGHDNKQHQDRTNLIIVVGGHLTLFAAMSLSLLWQTPPAPPLNEAIEVTFNDAVGLQSAAPVINTDPATAQAPEIGKPEDAEAAHPDSTVDAKPVTPQPNAVKPPPTPAKPSPNNAKAGSSTGTQQRGSILGSDFMKGISSHLSKSTNATPMAATVGAKELGNIQSLIARQIQPCANTRRNPGPGANRIKTKLRLQFRQDGSLAARPILVGQSGVDGDNSRYAGRVADLAIGAVVECAPIHNLPPELYKTANGQGWNDIYFNYSLPN